MPKSNYIRKVLSAGLGSKASNSNLQMRTETKLYPEIAIQQTNKNRLTKFTEPWDDETIIGEDSDEVFARDVLNKEQESQQKNIGEKIDGSYLGEVSKKALHPEGKDISNRNEVSTYSGKEENLKNSQEETVEKNPKTEENHIEEQNVSKIESEFKDRIPEVEIIKKPLMKVKTHTQIPPEEIQDISRKTQEETKIIKPIAKDDMNSETIEPSKAEVLLKRKDDKRSLSEDIQSIPMEHQEENIQETSDIASVDKGLSSIRLKEKRKPKPLRDKEKYYDKQNTLTIKTSPKFSRRKELEKDLDFEELTTEQIPESKEETTLVVKDEKNTQDTDINLPAKSREIKVIKDIKGRTEGGKNLKIQPQEQKIIRRKEKELVSSSLTRQATGYKPNVLEESLEIIQMPKEKTLHLNTKLYTESLEKNRNQISKIADKIAMIDEKLSTHIRKEHSKPRKPVFLPKRPPSCNLGGWNYLERNYLK
jgi:hypothetical protein